MGIYLAFLAIVPHPLYRSLVKVSTYSGTRATLGPTGFDKRLYFTDRRDLVTKGPCVYLWRGLSDAG